MLPLFFTQLKIYSQRSFISGILRIPGAEKTDGGEYECSATNNAGYDSKRVTVRVNDGGAIVRPLVTPPYYSGKSGDYFTLTCKARGPQRSITWSKLGGSLPYNSRQEDGILTISDARPEDTGMYICTVTSYTGTSGIERVSVTILQDEEG